MIRTMLASGLIAMFGTGVLAQEPPAVAAPGQIPDKAQQGLAEPPEPQFLVEIKILEYSYGLLGGDGQASPSASRDAQPIETRGRNDAVGASDLLLAAAKDASSPSTQGGVTRRGKDIWDADFHFPPGVTVISAPKLIVFTSNLASIEMTSKQSFTYLQPQGQGQFQRKQTELHELGVRIKLAVEPVDGEDEVVKVPSLEIQVAALDGREPVAGLEDLDVGEPIIGKRSLTTTAKLRLGETRFISIPTGPERHASLVLRITEAESDPTPPRREPK